MSHDNSDESIDDQVELAPPDGLSPAQREAAWSDPIEAAQQEVTVDDSWRLSLGELFIVITFGALGLAGPRYLPPAVFAGAAGIVTLISIVMLTVYASESRLLRLAWWTLPVLYLCASAAALLKSLGVW